VKIEHIETDAMDKHPEFSSIVSVTAPGKIHFLSGRCSTDKDFTVIAKGDMLGQYRQVMKLLTHELESIGATWDNVVYRRISTVDPDACKAAAREPDIAAYFDRDRMPGGTLIGVTRLANPDFLMEVDLIVVTE